MQKTCTALVKGNGGNECRKPVVQDAGIALCALHILLAAQEVEDLGRENLIELARADARSSLNQVDVTEENTNVAHP